MKLKSSHTAQYQEELCQYHQVLDIAVGNHLPLFLSANVTHKQPSYSNTGLFFNMKEEKKGAMGSQEK